MTQEKQKILTRSIWILSMVSLFTDVSSEMLYPVMPIFLKSIGFSIFYIGIIEGIAEATAGMSKGFFGNLSDKSGKRAPFVRLGYALSSIAKPITIFFLHPAWIIFVRTMDRLGKGIRTGARDAILSAETTPEHKGRVFGFHRGFDTLGAAIGPIISLVFLSLNPGKYTTLFLLAFIPGIIGVGITFLIKDKQSEIKPKVRKEGFLAFLKYWKEAPAQYKSLVTWLLIFAVVNSSDVFLLLMVKSHGVSDSMVIIIYIFYNLVYAATSHPIGILGDRIGFSKSLSGGLFVFAAVYCLMAFATDIWQYFALFLLYGLYAAATEGISKAWITNIAAKDKTATAIGFYTGWLSIATMIASTLAGLMWSTISPQAPFIMSGIVTLIIGIYILSSRQLRTQTTLEERLS